MFESSRLPRNVICLLGLLAFPLLDSTPGFSMWITPSNANELAAQESHPPQGFDPDAVLVHEASAPLPGVVGGTQGPVDRGLLERYQDQLTRLRSGSEEAETGLRQTAEFLAAEGRDDATRVAEFYLGLQPHERLDGWHAEQRFLHIRSRVQAAGTDQPQVGISRPWPVQRERLRAELLALIDSQREQPDVSASARAHALLTRLDVARLDNDASLQGTQRAEIVNRGRAHAQLARNQFALANQRTPQLEPLWLTAELLRLDGKPGEAQKSYRELLQLAKETQREEYQVRGLQGLVRMAREAGDTLAMQALLAEWTELQDPRTSWPLAKEQSLWLLSQDQARSALNTLWQCQPKAQADRLTWQSLLTSALRRRGHLPAARRALERLQSEFPQADFPHSGELIVLSEAHQEHAEGGLDIALQILEEHWPFAHWSANGRMQGQTLLGQVLLEIDEPTLALPHLLEAIQCAHQWESRRLGAENPGSVGSVSGEWLGMQAIVLAAQASAETGDLVGAAALLEQNQGRHWKRGLQMDLQTEAIRKDLGGLREQGAGVLTFGFGADFGIAIHLGPQGEGTFERIPFSRRQWGLANRRLREAIQREDRERAFAMAREMSTALIPAPIEASLRDREGHPLHLILHGPMQKMPLALLDWKNTALEHAFAVLTLPSASNAGMGPTNQEALGSWQNMPWRFLGAPSNSSAPELPEAQAELKNLASQTAQAILSTGSQLNRNAIEQALDSGDALHIATHLVEGSHCDGTGFAGHGLLLADDQVLCAHAIAERAPRSPLVYLGTCSSATGRGLDGEGTFGVARAFLAGGTQNLIVTLWPVTDLAAARFAHRMHQALAAGHPPSTAVQMGRQTLRQERFPMADWTAFQHLGWN